MYVLLLIYDLNYLTPNLCPRWELPFPLAVRFYKTNMNDCYRNSYFNGLLHRNELIWLNPLQLPGNFHFINCVWFEARTITSISNCINSSVKMIPKPLHQNHDALLTQTLIFLIFSYSNSDKNCPSISILFLFFS